MAKPRTQLNSLWADLITTDVLARGWHLARADTRNDFAEDLYSTDVFALDLAENLREIKNLLETGTYHPKPLLRMEVPKGALGFRPGSIIPIPDRVVASAIVYLLAPRADKRLPNSVYSWRVKHPLPKRGSIFYETDITDIPFLKKSTIRHKIDPFEPWYVLWPKFDEESRKLFTKDGYRFMATSDIAAYFENIQLPILRDLLLRLFPADQRIVNLLLTLLESWSVKTHDGRTHHRGIPQGNAVSSFLGNLFLLNLDSRFRNFAREHDAKYFRYVDDVRIFAKDLQTARLAVFTMDRTLRELHLNVQTAKTKILDEHLGEVTSALVDDRIDDLSMLVEGIQKHREEIVSSPSKKSRVLSQLSRVIRRNDSPEGRVFGAKKALDGLTLRAFNRWMTAHSLVDSSLFVPRLLVEIERSADARLTKRLVNACRSFPRLQSIQNALLTFLDSDKNIFSYQEAECLRAMRYVSRPSDGLTARCYSRIYDTRADRYLRAQAARLLARTNVPMRQLARVQQLFLREREPYVQVALACILVQRRENGEKNLQQLVFHANERVSGIGKLFLKTYAVPELAKARLEHAFREETPWILCDNMPFVHVMANSPSSRIRETLRGYLYDWKERHPLMDLRDQLRAIHRRVDESLA